jgi:N-acetyl-anhydromuramyl-L-alanine amidase AmpD
LLQHGFSAKTDSGEGVSVQPQAMPASVAAIAANGDPAPVTNLPTGCSNDGKTDYPGAIDCILDPALHDCDLVPGTNAPCNYFSSAHYSPTYRQGDGTITHVVIHDSEASTAAAVVNTFEDPNSNVAAHYIVDTDGTVYQIVHEKDVAFQAGNLWMNQHSVGIEHVGFDATGFQYYNSTEYQASAKLTAYLTQKYNIPLDHNHIVSHGTVPAPNLANTPNNVDPGPYWLWDYYLLLIAHAQGQAEPAKAALSGNSHILTLHPLASDIIPLGGNGTETPANFNFFYLYNGPSTKSGLIPQEGTGADITDETNNVEPDISYYFLNKVKDPAGTGDTLYEIWYGESDQAHATPSTFFTHGKLVWLAVPPLTAFAGQGTVVTLKSADGTPIQVSGSPKTNTATLDYHIGDAPDGAIFVSGYKVVEDGTNNVWYSINYNHRQAWVPAANIVETPQP